MAAKWICCSLLLLMTAAYSTQAIKYIVTVPNTLRFGVQETIGVSVSDTANPVDVQVYLQDHPGRKTVFSSQTLKVSNGQPKMTTVTVQPDNFPAVQRNDSQLYVYVVVKPTKGEFPAKEALVPIRKYSGYVFIQTDKPLYLPNQQVQIRILSLNEKMLPSKETFILEIQNPDNVRVMYKDMQPEAKGITETHFKFSVSPMFGNWTITVHYGFMQSAKSTVKFEVKEYVLPTFSVHIDPPKIILKNDKKIEGTVTASYVYGKPVQGIVNLKYEIYTPDKQAISIGELKNQQLGDQGQYDFSVDVEQNIKKRRIPWFPQISGSIFLVEAVVVEQATGNRETAVDRTSVFTNSPYLITFSRSLKDFKPSVPYQVQVDVYFASGQPVDERIEVQVESAFATKGGARIRDLNKQEKLKTDERGRVMFQFDTDGRDEQLQITVKTAVRGMLDENQATGTLTVDRYMSPVHGSYVWIAAPQDEITFKVGKTFQTSVTVYPAEARTNLYYVVVSRGTIVLFNEILAEGGALVRTVQFPVTAAMSPSARLIVFIIKNGKVIADSIQLEVEKACSYNDGEPLRLQAHTASGMFIPGQVVNLEIHGEPDSYVGLTAVDEALYVLNKQHLLTPETMFSEMKSHDLGCGPGGGGNTEAVFRNAGVVILSNVVIGDHARKGDDCKTKSRLKRAAVRDIAEEYVGTGFAEICCKIGRLEPPPNMTCAERAKIINDSVTEENENCSKAFLDCCEYQKELNSRIYRFGGNGGNDISSTEELIELLEENTLQSIRRYFPETWFFNTIQIGSPKCKDRARGVCRVPFNAPHSITTWKVQAVGISETKGMCIAEPLRIPVFKRMFIQLDLPYAAIRGEQIEVPATVFNYGDDDLMVNVYMFGVEGICMGASDGERSEIRKILVPANGAKTVTFTVVPLQVSEYVLRVVGLSSAGGDAIEKTLRVVAEGSQEEVSYPIVLDPTGFYQRTRKRRHERVEGITEVFDEQVHKQTITVDLDLPNNHVPGTGKCVVSVLGSIMGQAIATTLTGIEQKFIKLPTGCGEQTMIHMAPLVYTMLYLKRSNQMTATAEKNGYQFMEQGYMQQLKYRQPDKSFSVWTSGYASSTWLTAFVARVFCQADVFIRVSQDVKCGAVDWLLKRQRDNGVFYDAYKVHHREMTGGVQGDVTMTAFVLIALQECFQCDSEKKRLAVSRAVNFLEQHVDTLQRPYSVAITAYALTLANSLKAEDAVKKLKSISVYDENAYTRKWGVDASEFGRGTRPWIYQHKPDAVAVETTGYALLTMLLNDDIEYSHPIANWLNQQRSSSGSFVSTQDTVIALQALAEYSGKAVIPPLDMMCNVTSQVKGKRSITLNKHNALTLQEVELPVDGKLVVVAQGKGLGSMSVAVQYNVDERPEDKCKYELTIKTSEHVDRIAPVQPRRKVESDDRMPTVVLRSVVAPREMRELGYEVEGDEESAEIAPQGSNFNVIGLEVCVRYLSGEPSKMTVLDIGLITGHRPLKDDLIKLMDDKQRTKVSYYETTDRSVILYLEEVPNVRPLCLKLRTAEEIAVAKVQRSAVKVYNYYEPSESCTKFYRPDGKEAELQQICEGRHCVCVEGQCPKCNALEDLIKIHSNDKRYEKLVETACEYHHFVWLVKFIRSKVDGSSRNYEVQVKQVLKEGLQGKEDIERMGTVKFSSRIACNCPEMIPGQEYIIMGNDGFQYKTDDGETLYKYVFDKGTTVYHTQAIKLKPSEQQPLQKNVNTLIKRLANSGCPD